MPIPVDVNLNPQTRKVDQALARIRSEARNIDFGSGARSISKLSQPLGRITGQATEFEKSLEASNARVLAFGASVAVINKLSQAFSALVQNTIKVEATFAKINTILGGTNKEIQQFGRSIFQVARDTGTSFDQVAEGALELARQGLSAEESISRISTALKLVRVTGIDAEKAVGGLTAAIKGFEGSGLTVAQIADKISQADVKFAVSTKDLIDGLQRSAASARVAGVSFDELLASITVVQERTQRGGAVIGNAFKTIFSYIARPETLNYLESLGIQVVDAQGKLRDAIPIIRDLGQFLEKTGMQSATAANVIQKVAGVRQRDILINLIEDLNSSQSQFNKSLGYTAGAVGTLDQKQKALNDTLEYFINRTVTAGQEFAAMLGKIGFTDAAKSLLGSLSSALEGITDILDGESIGSKFAQGLVRGIGGILTGPGLILVGGIFLKLFVDLAKFGVTSLKNLLGINKAAQQQAALQQSIFQTIASNEAIQRELLALGSDKVSQERLLSKIYQDQIKALERIKSISASVSPALYGAGLRGGPGGVTSSRRGGTAAGGYIAKEASDVARGVGGAPTSAKVAVIPNFAFGGGQRGTMIANTSEYYVPNYAGGGDAIFNQNMVRSMGLPSGAKKITAAGGYIPNFATMYGYGLGGKGVSLTDKQATQFNAYLREVTETKNLKDKFGGSVLWRRSKEINPYLSNFLRGNTTATQSAMAKRESESLATQAQLKETTRKKRKYGFIYPGSGKAGYQEIQVKKGQTGAVYVVPLETEPANDFYKKMRKSMIDLAMNFVRGYVNPDIFKDQTFRNTVDANLNAGSVESAFGSIFESALVSSMGVATRSNADWDIGAGSTKKLVELFGKKGKYGSLKSDADLGILAGLTASDIKNNLNTRNLNSLKKKILNDPTGAKSNASFGYIPNFAMSPLEDAISRERSAGLPLNQIRINQSGKLRNSQNPMGLAVTNTRDEPTGAIPNFAVYNTMAQAKAGGLSDKQILAGFGGKKLKDEMISAAKAAETQTKATKAQTAATTDNMGKFFALSMVATGLNSAFATSENQVLKFGMEAANAGVNFAFYNSALKDMFTGFSKTLRKTSLQMAVGAGATGVAGTARGRALSAGARLVGGLGRALPVVGTGIAIGTAVAPLIMELMKTKNAFTELNTSLKELDLTKLQAGVENTTRLSQLQAVRSNIQESRKTAEIVQKYGGKEGMTPEKAIEKAMIESYKNVFEAYQKEDMGGMERFFSGEIGGFSLGLLREGPKKGITNILSAAYAALGESEFEGTLKESMKTEYDKASGRTDKSFSVESFIDSFLEAVESQIQEIEDDIGKGPKRTKETNFFAKDLNKLIQTQYSAQKESLLETREFGAAAQGTIMAGTGGGNVLSTLSFGRSGVGIQGLKDELELTTVTADRRIEITQQIERANKAYEDSIRKLDLQKKIIDEIIGADKYKEFSEEQKDAITGIINGTTDINKTSAETLGLTEEQLEKLKQEYSEYEGIKKILDEVFKREQKRAKLAASPKGFSDSLKQSAIDIADSQGFRMLGDNLGKAIPATFQSSMETALNNLATGSYDSLGQVFGQIALDFGQMLLQEMNRAIAAQLAGSIMQGAFGSAVGGFFSGLFPGKATGGYISGGSGVKDDVPAMLMGGEYVIRKSAVQKYGVGFLESLNQGQMPGFADGGPVQGAGNFYGAGSFWKDPKGNMMGGAASNARLARARQTEFFMPGYRGAGEISGKENLLAFAMQEGTSGATDVFSRSGTRLSANTELQSANLSPLGRIKMRESQFGQGLMQSKQQAFDLYLQRIAEEQRVVDIKKQAEQARSSAFKQAVIGAAVGSLAMGAASALMPKPPTPTETFFQGQGGFGGVIGGQMAQSGQLSLGLSSSSFNQLSSNMGNKTWGLSQGLFQQGSLLPGGANGGYFPSMRKFQNGGSANAMLMGGEYVISPQATNGIGKTMLDDINNMRYPMPTYANGGATGAAPTRTGSSSSGADIGAVNITINIEKNGQASVETGGSNDTGLSDKQSKDFAKRIKDVVVQVINEEKRVSGSLFTRSK